MDENKKINVDNLRIEKNIISFNNTLLQISNISQVSVEQALKKKLNFWSILIIVVGVLMAMGNRNNFIKGLGIMVILGAIGYIIAFAIFNYGYDEWYLHIYLSCGCVYSIYCYDTDFLEKVLEVIEYCINNHYVQEIKVDFKRCKLYNSPLIIGDENEVKQ